MLRKWQIARPKNLQPAAPRNHVVPYYKRKEESDEGCFACYQNNESIKFLIKLEYNLIDAPSTEEQSPKTAQGEAKKEPRRIGDGQEIPMQEKKKRKAKTTPKKKNQKLVATDEDWKNPAYIPRNEDYFNHDLRCTNYTVPRSKKQHIEIKGRWKHDKFREEDQGPKCVEELIATYGFDIRAGKNPYAKCPSSPTKRRNHPKIEVQNNKQKIRLRRRKDTSRRANKKLCDLPNSQSSSRNAHFEPGGYDDDNGKMKTVTPVLRQNFSKSIKHFKTGNEATKEEENKSELAMNEEAMVQ
ncbi:protein CASC3-like [Phyllobates terribilis]|uniref:protein CASC3-like n=1 Tax=Phyllobates terribilis TaxID=111132 RepID=UPI003CCB2498